MGTGYYGQKWMFYGFSQKHSHHPMIHFRNVNNFCKNLYFFMKQIFLKACIYYLSTPTVLRGLNKFWAQDISVKNGCFMDLAKNTATTQ